MVGIKSDVGNIRTLNEDYVKWFQGNNYKIFVVADGMGGHNAGEVASKMATENVVEYVKNNFTEENKKIVLKEALAYANSKVYEFAHTEEEYNGMGTTLVACIVTKDYIQVANVGDSSCIGIKGNVIRKITKDHSLVQELVDLGSITEEEAENHPQKNVITRAIGTKVWVDIDLFEIDKNDFDFYILCTDGLSNDVTLKEILQSFNEEKTLNDICEKLINIAKKKGGRDNITVMIFGGEV